MSDLVDRLATEMYGRELWQVFAEHGVFPLAGSAALAAGWNAPGLALLAGTSRVASPGSAIDLVVASTCVDHCDADPEKLSATVIADLLHGAVVARTLAVPMVSFCATGQETRLVPHGTGSERGWHAVSKAVQRIFDEVAPPGSRQLSTHDPDVWHTLTASVTEDREKVGDPELAGLYHLTDGSRFPCQTPFTYYYDYYRYNIAQYRIPVLSDLLGRPVTGVLVVENAQQIKAVAIARRLNARRLTEHLVTLPAPGRAGRERATRDAPGRRLLIPEVRAFFLDPRGNAPEALTGDPLHYWSGIRGLWLARPRPKREEDLACD